MLLFFAIFGAVVYGCGPSSHSPSSGAGSTTVHLAYFPNITHAAALVGTGRGTFGRAFGPSVHVEEQVFAAGPSEIEALFGNHVDIGYIGPGPAINGYTKSHGQALKIIAGSSSGGAAFVVRSDAGITDIKSLAGRRVGVPQTGGTQDISLRHALQGVGLSSTDKGGSVAILPNAPADTLTLFVKKELDAAWITEPWVSRLVKEGNGKVLIDERDLWPNRKFATTVIVVRTKFLEQHPDLVAKFLAAHIETVEWIKDHQDEAAAIVADRLKQLTGKPLPADVLKSALSRTDITYDPLSESVLTFAEWSKSLGYQKEDRSKLAGLFDLLPLNAALAAAHKQAIQ